MLKSIRNLYDNYQIRHDYYRKLNIEFHIVDHCNLNCKYCSHFSPISKPRFYDVEAFKNDIVTLSSILKNEKLEKIRILGGEPLLHPEINKFIELAYFAYPNANREIVSNGVLLLNMGNDFWETCRKTNTRVYVSRYPISLNYDEIETLLKNNQISHIIGAVPKWFDKHCFEQHTKRPAMLSHILCPESSGPYMQLRDGKLYKCSYSAYINNFNDFFGTNLKTCKQDYLDLHSISSDYEIYHFLEKAAPFCRFCNLFKKTYLNSWDYSKKDISEWM